MMTRNSSRKTGKQEHHTLSTSNACYASTAHIQGCTNHLLLRTVRSFVLLKQVVTEEELQTIIEPVSAVQVLVAFAVSSSTARHK
jgi:hypothetical protein